MELRPCTFRQACEFVRRFHRHNKPPRGHKFSVAIWDEAKQIGVGMAGRPIARAFDDGLTIEINRTCTDGTPNANSMLYGAIVRASKAMGYRRVITYTRADESGASLRATGFVRAKELPPRSNWFTASVKTRDLRDAEIPGMIARVLWEIRFKGD